MKKGMLDNDKNRMGYADGELVGGQKKLDKNNDGDITGEDFAMLREEREGKFLGGMLKKFIKSIRTNPNLRSKLGMDNDIIDDEEEEGLMPVQYPAYQPPIRLKAFQEGGEVEEMSPMDNQMAQMMPEKTEEQIEMEESQVPDEMMEDNYIDFLIDEALDEDEEEMLMQELQANPQLSMLFDKVMEVAMEFSGSGPVEGPGSEVSDSIPARLSDGEFVFTAKAVEVLGADNLMELMKQAEAQAEGRQMAQDGGLMEEEDTAMPVQQEPVRQEIRVTKETVGSEATMQEEEDLVGDELKKQMLSGRPHVRS